MRRAVSRDVSSILRCTLVEFPWQSAIAKPGNSGVRSEAKGAPGTRLRAWRVTESRSLGLRGPCSQAAQAPEQRPQGPACRPLAKEAAPSGAAGSGVTSCPSITRCTVKNASHLAPYSRRQAPAKSFTWYNILLRADQHSPRLIVPISAQVVLP